MSRKNELLWLQEARKSAGKHCADLQAGLQRLLRSCPQHSYHCTAIAASWLGNHGHIWTAEFFPQLHLAPLPTTGELQGVIKGRTSIHYKPGQGHQMNFYPYVLIHTVSRRNPQHYLYHLTWESQAPAQDYAVHQALSAPSRVAAGHVLQPKRSPAVTPTAARPWPELSQLCSCSWSSALFLPHIFIS